MSEHNSALLLLDELKQETESALRTRRRVAGLLLVMIALFVANLWWQLESFDADMMLADLEIHATTTVWPQLSAELEAVGEEAVPAISEALSSEANVLLIRATEQLTSESEVFQDNMARHMHRSLEAAFADVASEEDTELSERLMDFSVNPEVHEELLRRLQVSARQWAERELDSTFAEHVELLSSINESVQVLVRQAEEDESLKGQQPQDVLLLFVEIMNARLGGEG
ncbi:MAG: hypothetical protein CMP23_11735 [Rickettsiales bacterium]|nr:hypothetical protein [Rickettsiales bacterium]|tara:strand:+ start:636 stop:1319 length:684 start_codon:yes stop_codon:yes gene_type:complete